MGDHPGPVLCCVPFGIRLLHLLHRVRSCQVGIFLIGNLRNINYLGFVQQEIIRIRLPKQIFLILRDIGFQLIMTFDHPLILV